jgi:hypothetical protein
MAWLENRIFRGNLPPDNIIIPQSCNILPVSSELKNSVQRLPLFIRITPAIFLIIYTTAYLVVS